jgi:predicted RNase H-like HicB family nuclease
VNLILKKIILEEDEERGGYIVSCPALSGCHSQGDSKDEALENIKEAIKGCLESLSDDVVKEAFSRPSSKVVEVVV